MCELKQTNQFSEAVSLITGIVDKYLASKMKEEVDSTMKAIIKDQVKAQVSKIIPKIEKGRDDQDKDEDPFAGSDRGTKRRKSVGPAFNLLKGTCKSITKLEYHLEECSKATTERLEWHNPENKLYPSDLRKPLSLIQDHRGRQIILKDYFINNDLEYLKGEDLSRRYSNSVTKTKAATYELKWIEDLVPEL
nr:hypothetical protein [Tanacetum cinerariifolium]